MGKIKILYKKIIINNISNHIHMMETKLQALL